MKGVLLGMMALFLFSCTKNKSTCHTCITYQWNCANPKCTAFVWDKVKDTSICNADQSFLNEYMLTHKRGPLFANGTGMQKSECN